MGYEVTPTATDTVITVDGIKVKISNSKPTPGTAFATGTLYKDDRGFTPVKTYTFQSMTGQAGAESLKKLAAFFFASLLDTELYIVEIPRDSALFPEEARRIFGDQHYERAI